MDASEKINLPAPGQFGDAEPLESKCASDIELLKGVGVDLVNAPDIFRKKLPPFDWIVKDLIAAGADGQRAFKGDLISGSKGRKSFFALQLGLCIASGKDVCGWTVPRPRRVVYCNLELVEKGLQERLERMCDSLGLDKEAVAENFTPLTIDNPGMLRREDVLGALIRVVNVGGYSLLVMDPQYKLYQVGEDECTGLGLSGVLKFRDRLITETRAAVLMVAHDPKGSSGERKITDRGAGSGFAGRDYDYRLTLTAHADGVDEHVVLSSSSRYRAKHPDRTLVFDAARMVFDVDTAIDPTVQTEQSCRYQQSEEYNAEKAASDCEKAKAVAVAIADESGLIDQDLFLSRLKKKTGWGNKRVKGALAAQLALGECVASVKQLQRKPDGTVCNVLHAKTLVGTPSKVQTYLESFGMGGK